MKKLGVLFITGLVFLVLESCNSKDKFIEQIKPEYLEIHEDGYRFEENILPVFPDLENYYNFTADELKIIGSWHIDERQLDFRIYELWCFPNNFVLMVLDDVWLKNTEETINVSSLYGTWYIEDDTLKTIVIGYKTIPVGMNTVNPIQYILIEPVEYNIIKMTDISERGYAEKPLNSIELPHSISVKVNREGFSQNKPEHKISKNGNLILTGWYLFREFYYQREAEKDFGLFKNVIEIAEMGLTGEEMAKNYEKYQDLLYK